MCMVRQCRHLNFDFEFIGALKTSRRICGLRAGMGVPRILEPSEIPIGATVFADRGQCVFTVTRRTHNGKRTLALGGDGKEVCLMPGTRGDGYMTAARGFSLVSPEWARRKEDLNKLWQAVFPPPVSVE